MKRIHFVCAIVAAAAVVALVTAAKSELSKSHDSKSAENESPEISESQYALLADPDSFPDPRLEEARQFLVDDGKISRAEFAALNLQQVDTASAKQLLVKRLTPKLVEGIRLHPGEELPAFRFASCQGDVPRRESSAVKIGHDRYQIRDLHYCGMMLVSGFYIYRNGVLWNTAKHFGHPHAQVFVSDGCKNLIRMDMSSVETYRLLVAFYDREISDEAFLRSILDPEQIATASEGGTPSLR